jgi:hypothetical protein
LRDVTAEVAREALEVGVGADAARRNDRSSHRHQRLAQAVSGLGVAAIERQEDPDVVALVGPRFERGLKVEGDGRSLRAGRAAAALELNDQDLDVVRRARAGAEDVGEAGLRGGACRKKQCDSKDDGRTGGRPSTARVDDVLHDS